MKSAGLVVLAACGSPPSHAPRPPVLLTSLAAAPARDGSIGTAHPVVVEQVAADGRWLVIAQARRDTDGDGRISVDHGSLHRHVRHGDALVSYLVFGSGAGLEIDHFAASDPQSRWLAVVHAGTLYLSDGAGHATALDADPQGDVAFADDGSRMIYLRRGTLVIRELARDGERVVPIAGPVAWVQPDAHARWARVVMRASDEPPEVISHEERVDCYLEPRTPVRWVDLDRGVLVDPVIIPADARAQSGKCRRRGGGALARDVVLELASASCSDAGCVDAATKQDLRLPRGEVWHGFAERVLMKRDGQLIIYDVKTKQTRPFPGADVQTVENELIFATDGTYDILTLAKVAPRDATVLDEVPGKLLVAMHDRDGNLIGPLRWIAH